MMILSCRAKIGFPKLCISSWATQTQCDYAYPTLLPGKRAEISCFYPTNLTVTFVTIGLKDVGGNGLCFWFLSTDYYMPISQLFCYLFLKKREKNYFFSWEIKTFRGFKFFMSYSELKKLHMLIDLTENILIY